MLVDIYYRILRSGFQSYTLFVRHPYRDYVNRNIARLFPSSSRLDGQGRAMFRLALCMWTQLTNRQFSETAISLDFLEVDDEIHMKHLLDHYSIQLTRIYIVNIYLVCIWSIKVYFKYMYLSNVCLLKKLIYISKILFPLHNHYNMNY